MTLQQKIKDIEIKLRNNPTGIPASQIPEEASIRKHLRGLFDAQKAIWVHKRGEWYYLLLRNYGPPMGISKWKID